MTYRTILVSLNHEEHARQAIAAAALLARPVEAHVIGLYVMPPLFMPSDVILPMGSEFYEQQIAEHREQAARIEKLFLEMTKGDTYVAEWRVHGDVRSAYESIADGVVAEARSAELVIVSQAVGGDAPPMLTDVPQRLALECGRPVLIIPGAWQPAPFGKTVAIAWNDSREAARATFDALPLLNGAQNVCMMTLGAEGATGDAKSITAADVAATLARRGLNVTVDAFNASSGNIAQALLARAHANAADLLVMGAYGHSRMREFILGGATRDMLKSMTIPVLMSH